MHSATSLPVSLLILLLSSSASAKTDLTGCTTTDLTSPAGASQAWYVPGTGELCDPLDCGGGRAPPKANVPGCPAYTGTDTYSPSFLAGFTAAATAQTATPSAATTSPAESLHTESTETDWSMPTSTGFDTTVTGASATVDPSNRPLICALQASSDPNCGISWSTTTSYTTTSTNTIDDSSAHSTITSSAQVSSGAVASVSQSKSMTLSLVRTVPNTTAAATSSAASVSTGGAATITGVASGLGLLVAAFGGLAML